jgi:hypothetical protein
VRDSVNSPPGGAGEARPRGGMQRIVLWLSYYSYVHDLNFLFGHFFIFSRSFFSTLSSPSIFFFVCAPTNTLHHSVDVGHDMKGEGGGGGP